MAQLGSTVVTGSLTVTDDVNLVKPLSIANGGTGQTSATNIVNETLQSGLGTGDSVITDDTSVVTTHINGYSTTNKGLYRRAISLLNSYFNTRIAGRPNLTCSTEGATAAKTVALAGFVLSKGAQLIITFSNANTVATPTLNINSTGAKEIRINRTTVSTDSSSGNYLKASTAYYAHYDGTYWQLDTYQVPLARYAASAASATDCSYPESKFDVYCDTAAGTAAKVGRCRGYASAILYKGTILSLRVTVANTAASPTLNVQSSGAKTIYINGAAVSSSNQLSVGLYIAYYDGTYWQLIRTNSPNLNCDMFYSPDVAFSYTAAATVAKTAVMPSYKLITGARFRLYIVNTNTANNPTLSVNGTTAKPIAVNGTKITTSSVGNLAVGWYEVIYDGTNYYLYSSTNVVTPVTAGGTGATSAADARTNLGVQASITGAATSITSSDLTASRALVSNSSGKVAVSSITSTKLGYLTDVTSNIQAQINAKAGTAVATQSSDGLMSSADKTKLDGITITFEIV